MDNNVSAYLGDWNGVVCVYVHGYVFSFVLDCWCESVWTITLPFLFYLGIQADDISKPSL